MSALASSVRAIRWDGGTIEEPGLYANMSLEAYHSDCCDGPSISSSGLRMIEAKSPAHYWAGSYLNPDREPFRPSAAMILGSAAHHLLLGEEGFHERFGVSPDVWTKWTTDASKQWRAEMEAAGKLVLTPEAFRRIEGMALALDRHPVAGDFLRGQIEHSMFWPVDVPIGGGETLRVFLKARPDSLPMFDATIADLKVPNGAVGANPDEVERKLVSLGYAMQLAFACMGWKALTGESIKDAVLISVESEPPHVVTTVPVRDQTLYRAAQQCCGALSTFARCWAAGDWPGYSGDGRTIQYPDWLERRLQAREEAGELPKIEGGIL
ncbi:PD-(D/E)XK nuclease-like domain-containing protein [Acuticoccus kandeliae]|uniref:PD-(D/E)XK nuclease-like domain-containing protein n=1 Tax=Acuticoccus kandeliae TaxID=2073160 RepID=UPI0013001D26|nr:PD-(D/E)XK nuclease-like domain-containing protein [Acuticoccus kandeliae]